MKYTTTMFSGISKSAYIKIEKEFFEFLDNIYNDNIHSKLVNDQFYTLFISLEGYTGFDVANNDPLTDEGVEYVKALDLIVSGARDNGLNEIELESE